MNENTKARLLGSVNDLPTRTKTSGLAPSENDIDALFAPIADETAVRLFCTDCGQIIDLNLRGAQKLTGSDRTSFEGYYLTSKGCTYCDSNFCEIAIHYKS